MKNAEKKEFKKAEAEVVRFEKNDDIKTELSGLVLGGEGFEEE